MGLGAGVQRLKTNGLVQPQESDIMIECDAVMIEQVISNLLRNPVKAQPGLATTIPIHLLTAQKNV